MATKKRRQIPNFYTDGLKTGDGSHRLITLVCRECGSDRVIQLSCGDRICAVCSRKRYGLHLNRYRGFFASLRVEHLRMLSLTIKNGFDLAERRKHLVDSFRRLMSLPFYKDSLVGGIYAIETTVGKDGSWHVHLHMVYEGSFVDADRLRADWLDITGDSFIVDIRYVHKKETALSYILKYALKVSVGLTDGQRRNFNEVFKHKRLLQTFGVWHGQMRGLVEAYTCSECGSGLFYVCFTNAGYALARGIVDKVWQWSVGSDSSP